MDFAIRLLGSLHHFHRLATLSATSEGAELHQWRLLVHSYGCFHPGKISYEPFPSGVRLNAT
jgi:hypothetical protein